MSYTWINPDTQQEEILYDNVVRDAMAHLENITLQLNKIAKILDQLGLQSCKQWPKEAP